MKTYTLFNYIARYGDKDFDQMAFNEVDAVILSTLSYVNFKDLVPPLCTSAGGICLNQLYDPQLEDHLLFNTVTPKKDRILLRLCAGSVRFGRLQVHYAMDHFDKENCIQFFAVSFLFQDKLAVVAYRGTDTSIIGWKEDFLMSLQEERPVYSVADAYLSAVYRKIPHHRFIIAGHSKGGALATFAATFAAPEIQNQILRVYDLDGPGFHSGLKDYEGFRRIQSRIVKLLPSDSMVGILLETDVEVEIIRAKSFSIWQHSPYQWLLYGPRFLRAKKQTSHSKKFQMSMKRFLLGLTEEEKKAFIDTLFDLIRDMKVENVQSFTENMDQKIVSGIRSLTSVMKDETKGPMFKKVIRTFLTAYFFTSHPKSAPVALKSAQDKKQD